MNGTGNGTITIFSDANITEDKQNSTSTELDSMIYRVRIIVLPILCVIGFAGNFLILFILGQKRNRGTSTSLYLLFLAIFDTLTILTGNFSILVDVIWDFDVRSVNTVTCKLHVFLTYIGIHVGSWILVLITCERIVSVFRPHKVRIICSRKVTFVSLIAVIVFLSLLNGHFLVGMTYMYSPLMKTYCDGISYSYVVFLDKIYPFIDFLITFAIPCPIIVVGNTLICYQIGKLSRQRQHMVSSEQKGTSLTVTLLLLNIIFIVSVGPLSIYLFLYPFLFEISNENEQAVFYFILELLNIVAGLNASINFVLYFLCGSKFRAEVKALLCCKNSQNQTGTF